MFSSRNPETVFFSCTAYAIRSRFDFNYLSVIRANNSKLIVHCQHNAGVSAPIQLSGANLQSLLTI